MLPWMAMLAYAPSADGGDPSADPEVSQFKVVDSKSTSYPPPYGIAVDTPVAAISWRTKNVNDTRFEWVLEQLDLSQQEWTAWDGTIPPLRTPVELAVLPCSASTYDHTLTRAATPLTYTAVYTIVARRIADGERLPFVSAAFTYTRVIPGHGTSL